jgi:mono/diheme cytochrome c family protein
MIKHLALLVIVACTGAPTGPTGSTCPPVAAPTYQSFGRHFFATYCSGCHSRDGDDRHGAPIDQRFDSEADIRTHAREIDEVAARGPKASNDDMPDMSGPVRTAPSVGERVLLGELLACEVAPPRADE